MGSEKRAKGEEDEGEIPVLTVLKNNTILKNIFIVNKPPEEPEKASRGEHVDVLLVGRHPDCDLMLTHPSISRFHLQIRSKPSTRAFSVVDLSSVHGTWVSGKRIEPMVSVEMREGDVLRIGVSSRVYRLHWIPISRAYDLENPFVAQLDVLAEEEEGEEEEEEEEEEKMQKLNGYPAEMEVDSIVEDISSLFPDENVKLIVEVDSIVEDISSLFLDENVKLTVEEEIHLAPWMLEEKKSPSQEEAIGTQISDGEKNLGDSVSQVLSPPYVESLVQGHDILTEKLSETLCLPAVEAVLETKMLHYHTPHDTLSSSLPPGHENSFEKLHFNLPKETECEYECTDRDDEGVVDAFPVPAPLDEKSLAEDDFTAGGGNMDSVDMLPPVKEAVLGTLDEQIKIVDIVAIDSSSDIDKQDMYRSQSQLGKDKFCHDRRHSLNEITQDVRNKCTGIISSPTSRQIESVNLSMTQELVFNIMNKDQTMQSDMEILESCVKAVEKTSTNHNIWSRRGKANRAPQVRTSKSTVKNVANVDAEVAMSKEKDIRNRTVAKNLFSVQDGEVEEEEIFTPDKENFSPNTLQKRLLKEDKVEEIKHSRSQRSRSLSKHRNESTALRKMNQKDIINKTISKDLFSVSDGEKEEEFFALDKENISPNTLQLRLLKKKGKVEEINRSKSERSPLSKGGIFNLYPNERTGKNTTISDFISDLNGEEEEEEIITPNKENIGPNTLQLHLLKNMGKVEEVKCFKCQKSPLSKGTFNPDVYPNESIGPAYGNLNQNDIINSSISDDLISDLDGEEEEEEIFTPNKENFSPNTLQLSLLKNKSKVEEIECFKSQKSPLSKGTCNPDMYQNESILNQNDTINSSISKGHFSDLAWEEEDEEVFTPDKENFSPNALKLRLLKKKDKVAEIKHSKSPWKENQKLQRKPFCSQINLAQEQHLVTSEDRVQRVPFQSLNSSADKGKSNTFSPVSSAKSFHFSNCGQILDQHINHPSDISGLPKKSSWDMIVDTTSLVNKESRKALQLLQGLKGTRLIIPRLVIRELDRMMRQFKIFRRTSEASLALEWIEECMVKTNWWIKIQSSADEGRLIAPTPPASPQSQFSEDSVISPSYQKCMEIASPTLEDHILDFALLYRRNQNDGQVVLLSEDIPLKIKCMAEGLLCEAVQEFRESLVNPFSERFLWTNSSPRGQTWSCKDDVVLRERYYRAPLCKSSKTTASGLKLILLHNSKYGL
ncbi:FHA domain-containing protein [Vigna angularis]|uniref:FHA domain-containing protein n=2 Tax=Phaseolus angularis TaxID=3914 RepID=A0A8T0JV57_PHAAN|nr:FHA domain-containing protein PS1 [Vigna angularis]KAG2384549.1 FHA domain-containing protein [Vigna angularis]BAU01899.1 hypothetical protein VIGAN_11124700 [Vigna angularis var. angularis]